MLQPIAAYLNALLCVNHALHVCSYEDKPGSNPNLPDEEMHDNIVRYNIIRNVKSAPGIVCSGRTGCAIREKNQRGIEVGGNGYANPATSYNNSTPTVFLDT